MRVWKTVEVGLSLRQTDAISDLLGDWLREALATAPPGPVEVEINLAGYDEAGYLNPDFDWVGMVAVQFPHLQARVTYHVPRTREDAVAPYEVRIRWGTTTRRALIEIQGPGRWTIFED